MSLLKLIPLALFAQLSDKQIPRNFLVFCLQFLGEEEFLRWNLPLLLRSFGISFLLAQKLGFGKKHRFITHSVILGLFKSLRCSKQYLRYSANQCSMLPEYEMQVIASDYLKRAYIRSKEKNIWIVLQVCWLGIMVASDGFTEEYNSLNNLLTSWLHRSGLQDHPLIHGMKMIVFYESGLANSAFMLPFPSPSKIMEIICTREKDAKPFSFFHFICKGMIYLHRNQKGYAASQSFETAKSLLMLEDPTDVELYMRYVNKMLSKFDEKLKELPKLGEDC